MLEKITILRGRTHFKWVVFSTLFFEPLDFFNATFQVHAPELDFLPPNLLVTKLSTQIGQSIPVSLTWTSTRQNLSSGFPTKRDSNQSPQLHGETSWTIEISPVASLEMILSKKRITKALISLRGYAGWSAPLLFSNP